MPSARRQSALTLLLLAVLSCASTTNRVHAQAAHISEPEALTSRFIALAIQGELIAAQALLEQNAEQDPLLLELYVSRFVENSHRPDPSSGVELTDRVIEAYRTYWSDSLMQRKTARQADAALADSISAALGTSESISDATDSGAIYHDMETALQASGFHVLHSPAPPLRDLYLWRGQTTHRYDVRLTDRTLTLHVIFMDDLVSLGWKEYASLGLATTTGWVEDGLLYCVSWAYDRDSENFRVSYLKHEARHLADLRQFPEMDTTELEYRAKLTELAFSHTTTQRILGDFSDKAANNPGSAHAMANLRVVNDIHRQLQGTEYRGNKNAWSQYSSAQVNRAARSLLESSTQKNAR